MGAACGAEVPPAQFREVLDQVERHKLLSPLQVVSTLSSCPTATLGVVRDYLLRTIDSEEKSIAEDRKVIDQYQQQSKEVRTKIDRLNGQVTVFQSTKCSVCGQELELPTVHFLCGHGFHQHCFQSYSESDSECPICYKEGRYSSSKSFRIPFQSIWQPREWRESWRGEPICIQSTGPQGPWQRH